MKTRVLTGVALLLAVSGATLPPSGGITPPWGAHGHLIAAQAASRGLPADMPAFFGERADQLAYLNPEPDRWRGPGQAMDEAFASDHYIDLERVPDGAMENGNRWDFLRALYGAGFAQPEDEVGLLPYRILELYQRLESAFARWRRATDDAERRWIEDRIINDAGTLGHYVTDAAQPHHTTIHFNGWDADTPNPEGYGVDRTFHQRFESDFIDAHVGVDDLGREMAGRTPRRLSDVRSAVLAHIFEAHEEVEELYRLDRDVGFEAGRRDPRTVAFAVVRLASGAGMLQDLWWTAWVESGE